MFATLVKGAGLLGLIGFAALEIGSPVLLRLELDDTAHTVADEAVADLAAAGGAGGARSRAADAASSHGATLTAFSVGADGRVDVVMAGRAHSYLLHRVASLDSWYDVEVEATSAASSRS